MAACGSLRHIFDNPITENNSSSSSSSASLIDSLTSWKQIKPLNPPLDHSLTEIFGELHFKENHHPTPAPTSSFFTPPLSSSSSSSLFSSLLVPHSPDNVKGYKNENSGGIKGSISDNNDGYLKPYHRKSDSFSFLNSDSLQLCTEGLGSESLGDVEDLKSDNINYKSSSNNMGEEKERVHVRRNAGDTYSYCRSKRAYGKAMFPPPISYLGQSGKPAVSFQSYREDGRFVLKEVRIPTQECLQASREDGRLRLSFVQSNDDDEDDENGGEEEQGELGCFGKIEENEGVEDETETRDDV